MNKYTFTMITLLACNALQATTPYITKVWEYRPAPGQFVNLMPVYEEGDDAATMCQKAEQAIANNAQSMICLGSWGGYVVFSFDHPIVNSKGNYDFIVHGNAFNGSSEPGIVCVSYDANGNGLPDDTWYELAGSAHSDAKTIKNYQVTYTRPAASHVPTPNLDDQPQLIDTTHVKWADNKGNTGYIMQLSFHEQPYYPQWIPEEKMVFSGTRLPDNGAFNAEKKMYVQTAFDYGYVDNLPNKNENAKLKISWAVKSNGTAANLPAVHFVKVYTGVHQQFYGTTGETSTEIKGAQDLHPDMPTDLWNTDYNVSKPAKIMQNGQVYILRPDGTYNLYGVKIE